MRHVLWALWARPLRVWRQKLRRLLGDPGKQGDTSRAPSTGGGGSAASSGEKSTSGHRDITARNSETRGRARCSYRPSVPTPFETIQISQDNHKQTREELGDEGHYFCFKNKSKDQDKSGRSTKHSAQKNRLGAGVPWAPDGPVSRDAETLTRSSLVAFWERLARYYLLDWIWLKKKKNHKWQLRG